MLGAGEDLAGQRERPTDLAGKEFFTPQEALDTACALYYADTSDKPSPGPQTNLRG